MKSSISRWTKVISVGAFSLIPQTRPMRLFGAVLLAALVSTSAAAKPGGPGHGDCRSCGDTPLWGYADLHTHPASNFAFGANEKGENGVIHGKPGLAYTSDPVLEDFNLISDLPSCDADQHGDIWWDLVKDGTRSAGFSALDGSPGGNHLPSGFVNDFYGWPDARSVTHQQMHVQWLHRAWEGGLRLMVASTVDNQVLAALWGKDWFQLFHADELGNAGEKDYESARRQLKAIEDMAAANSKWMAIARSGTEARQIIAAGKLALVLGLEQDSLSIDDILSLRDEFGVTVVHPIHLVDNDLGGTAVYDDLFNTATKSLEGNYVEVEFDPSVRYRYGAPHYLDEQLAPIVLSPDPLQDLIVTPVDENDWQCQNGWESCVWPDPLLTTAGHRNALGLTDTGRKGIAKLLDKGMIMDLAHMGDKAREDVLDIADTCLRPVIDSHTALRLDLEDATHALDPERREASERDLLEADAVRIANGGGIVGLGTAGPFQPVTLFRAEGEPLERMGNPATNPDLVDTQTWQFDEAHLRIALHTGKDGMRGQEDFDPDAEVHATVTHADNSTDEWTLQEYRDGDLKLIDTFEDWGYDWVTVPLRAGTRANEVVNLKLTLVQDTDDWKADNWDLQGIEVYYVGREEARRLYHEHAVGDDVVHRFSKNDEADKPKDGPS